MADLRYCKNCGTKVESDVNFCSKCGTNLASKPVNRESTNKDFAEEAIKTIQVKKTYSNKSIIAAILVPITFVVILLFLSSSSGGSSASGDINPDNLVSKIEESMGLKFNLDPLGKVADEKLDRWYGASKNGNGISLLFYSDSDSLLGSASLKDFLDTSNGGGGYCATFAYFGDNYNDVENIYNILIQNYPDCKPSEQSSSSDTTGGENYSSDSVAGSGTVANAPSTLPVCQKLANTLDGGLRYDPNHGSHWGISTGKPGYCILPNSGGEKYYYSGE